MHKKAYWMTYMRVGQEKIQSIATLGELENMPHHY